MPLPQTLRKRMAPVAPDPLRDSLLQELENYLKHEDLLGPWNRGRMDSFSSEENVERAVACGRGHSESDQAEVASSLESQPRPRGQSLGPRGHRGPPVYAKETPSRLTRFDHEQSGRLEEQIRLSDLQQLEVTFSSHRSSHRSDTEEEDTDTQETDDGSKGSQEGQRRDLPRRHRRRHRGSAQPAGAMNRAEFRETLQGLLGSDRWGEQMDGIFDKVDTSGDGYVDWGEFCTYMLMQYRERDFARARDGAPFPAVTPTIRHCTHNKQEVCTRLLTLSSPPPLRLVSVSKEGVLTVWDRHLRLQRSFQEEEDPRGGKRRFRTWSTDAVVLPDIHKIAVSTTSRDLRFYDVSTPNFTQEFQLFALNNVPTCMDYAFNDKAPGSASLLLWGDDAGDVNLLTILRPHAGLFEKPFSREEGVRRIFMQDLGDHARLLRLRVISGVHEGPVRALRFLPDGGGEADGEGGGGGGRGGGRGGGEEYSGGLLLSCCESSRTSLVLRDVAGRRKAYVWSMSKGCQCFDYSRELTLVAAAGADGLVVVWNEYVTARPVARLRGHAAPVLALAIVHERRTLISYGKDAVVKVWDLREHACLQTLCVRFPCAQPGRALRHGDFPLLLLPPPLHGALVSCADYLALLPLGAPEERRAGVRTHAAAITAAAYNPLFRQVVTGGEDSCVLVWDVATGAKWLALNNAHGDEEITSLGFDSSGRRLLSGARNGTVKVWNVQNGHNLLKLQPVGAAEVTGVTSLRERKLLTVGWNRKILLYDDANPDVTFVKADSSWKGGQLHREDILAVSYSPALGLLATASYDGVILVWSVETQKLFLRLGEHGRSREPRPVDRLLFLPARAADSGLRDAALLLSSEGGRVHRWRLFGSRLGHLGSFYAAAQPDELVLGLASNHDDSVLVTGDTAGFLRTWDLRAHGLRPGDTDDAETPAEEAPALLRSWAAHDGAVIHAEAPRLDAASYVVSASSDRTAKLWTLLGEAVGTFGQERPWDVKDPATYQSQLELAAAAEAAAQAGPVEGPRESDRKREAAEGETAGRDAGSSAELESLAESGEDEERSETRAPGETEVSDGQKRRLRSEGEPGNGDATFRHGANGSADARKARRARYSAVNIAKTARFESLCSPFQALVMPEVVAVELPADLPVTARMRIHGASCRSVGEPRAMRLNNLEWEQEAPAAEGGQEDAKPSVPTDLPPGHR